MHLRKRRTCTWEGRPAIVAGATRIVEHSNDEGRKKIRPHPGSCPHSAPSETTTSYWDNWSGTPFGTSKIIVRPHPSEHPTLVNSPKFETRKNATILKKCGHGIKKSSEFMFHHPNPTFDICNNPLHEETPPPTCKETEQTSPSYGICSSTPISCKPNKQFTTINTKTHGDSQVCPGGPSTNIAM